MRRLAAALACRVQGSRLYGKPLQHLDIEAGVTILDHLISLIHTVPCIDTAVLGVSEGEENAPFYALAGRRGVGAVTGDQRDVLKRLIECGRQAEATDVFRVTTESPFFYFELAEAAWARHVEAGNDVTTVDGLPEGCHFELYTLEALERSHRLGDARHRSEFCSLYVREHLKDFRVEVLAVPADVERMDLRLTVDYPEDLVVCRAVYAALRDLAPRVPLAEIVQFLDARPELKALVAMHVVPKRLWEGAPAARGTPVPSPARERTGRTARSQALKERAARLIPSGTQTFSKGPTQFVQGAAPVFLVRGQGSRVWDLDGNAYIDYPMALGPIILGHRYPAVSDAVARQMQDGTIFSLPHPLEVEVAQRLTEIIPCAEMVRFGKNGSDATSGAVRAARACTGREVIACCGYHGWQDWYIGTTTRHRGVPAAVRALTTTFEYNRIETLERVFERHPGQVAAVILEPVGLAEPKHGFLSQVRELTRREGAVLIFDEVVTGFRLALGGAQEYFGVMPDLACFGKGMANGYPLSAVVGRRDLMSVFDEIFFSFTFGGETLSLAAAAATIDELRSKPVLRHIWEQGARLKDGYNALAGEFGLQRRTHCAGLPPRTLIVFTEEDGTESLVLKSLFQQECLSRGILFSGNQNICYQHSAQDVNETLAVYRVALEIIAEAVHEGTAAQRLKGEPVQPVFRKA
jgi:glutamate-1-semialdehyde 2,1-aminomutase/spore coat polysaccharide biosynthesis protein SpsF